VFKLELQLIGSMVNREPLPWNIPTTPTRRAPFQMLGVFAEFERAIIQERINAGIARAREKGTKSLKPIGRARIDPKVENEIRASIASAKGVLKTARELKVGSSTVQRIRAAMAR